MPEALFTRNATETTCATPIRDRRMKFNVMIVAMTSVALPVVVTRLVYKQFFSVSKRLNSEDWTIVAAIFLGLPSVALTIFGLTAHGLGVDIWGLSSSDLVSFGRYFYAIQIIYILLMLLVKLTLTFFYLNIFSGRRVRILLWGTVVFHVLAAVSFSVALIFQCMPINYQWEMYNYKSDMSIQGRCLNVNAGAWANSAVSVASDIWLLAIPLSQIYKLRLHWKKKLGAAIMFLTGVIVTVVSFLRLASIKNYATTSNPTWDQWSIVWWSTIELEVGFICTCLPTIRLILVRVAPRAFGTNSSRTASSMNMNRLPSNSTMNALFEADGDADFDLDLPKHLSESVSNSLDSGYRNSEQQNIPAWHEHLDTIELRNLQSIGGEAFDMAEFSSFYIILQHVLRYRAVILRRTIPLPQRQRPKTEQPDVSPQTIRKCAIQPECRTVPKAAIDPTPDFSSADGLRHDARALTATMLSSKPASRLSATAWSLLVVPNLPFRELARAALLDPTPSGSSNST
ncbi:hypothetical protein NLG97_g7629 [Lecanicillium saksenae]|uniref:Uncharacterized protein n=1 Tax=Lecanicillium saksenae TaxID=468837 RepID=A0ACC1QNT5_9HYPO|nr:hypothetical protein NLG97_g7629 [Lecanicillium saksenae]